MNIFYTYVLKNSLDGYPFYIGKGKGDRAESHKILAISNRHYNPYLQRKIKKILNNGGDILTDKLYHKTEAEAYDYERSWIVFARKMGFELCNNTDGGEGGNTYKYLTEEQLHNAKKKLSQRHKGIPLTEAHKRKISEVKKGVPCPEWQKLHLSKINKGKPSPMKGKHLSDESKLKISIAKKGQHMSEEAKIKISNKLKGILKPPMSDEHKRNLSIALKGKTRSVESINKQKNTIRLNKLLKQAQ